MSMNQKPDSCCPDPDGRGAFVSDAFAQGFFIMGDETVETCGGTFMDAGNDPTNGTGNPYPNENYTYTICPDNPDDAVSVSFVAFGLQTNPNPNNSDYLFIYDGPDAGSPSMGNYTGNTLAGIAGDRHGEQSDRMPDVRVSGQRAGQ